MSAPEDPYSGIHRAYREQCKAWGTYRPMTPQELEENAARWKIEADKALKIALANPQRRRKRPARGT